MLQLYCLASMNDTEFWDKNDIAILRSILLDPEYNCIFVTLKMPSQQLASREDARTRTKVENIELQEEVDPAQHTPLYPSLLRIGYVPNLELHQARLQSSRKRLQACGGVGTLPKGWPQVLQGPLVWSGSELQTNNEWAYDFSEMDMKEIFSALEYCKGECDLIFDLCQRSPRLSPETDRPLW